MKFEDIKMIVFDLNGTLSNYGRIDLNIRELFNILHQRGIKTVMVTSDQRHTANSIAKKLGVEYVVAESAVDKGNYVKENCKKDITVAIGNARNDIPMFECAGLSIVTLQSEGIHTEVLKYADVVVPSFKDALNLLIDKDTFESTLKE